MERKDYEMKELLIEEVKTKKAIRTLLALNTALIIIFGTLSILAAQQAETKVDFRYYNLKSVIAKSSGIWVNEFTGETFTNEADYKASTSHNQKAKRRTLIQKWFNSLSK